MKGSGIERERMKTSWALKMDVRYWLGWDGWHYCSYYLALLWLLKRAGKKKWDCQRGLKRKEKRGEKRKIYPELSLEGKERKKRFCLLLVQPPVVVGLEESSSCKLLLSKARSSKKRLENHLHGSYIKMMKEKSEVSGTMMTGIENPNHLILMLIYLHKCWGKWSKHIF